MKSNLNISKLKLYCRDQKFLFPTIIIIILFFLGKVSAQDLVNKEYQIKINKETIIKGYTAESFEKKIKLSLVPGTLKEATALHFIELHEGLPGNASSTLISEIYQYEFLNKQSYNNHKPFYIQLSYAKSDDFFKQVYFFDKTINGWRPLPTVDYPKENFVRSLIHLPFARIAVFSDHKKLTVGQASWYAHKPGNFAASPDFSKGTWLRVTNQANKRFIDVEVNDFGPDRKIHPERVVDLEKNAFMQIAELGDGVVKVAIQEIEKKNVVVKKTAQVLGIKTDSASEKMEKKIDKNKTPEITSKSGIIINQKNGEIIWEKNSSQVLPLASLTKIVAISTFLESDIGLDTVVTYSVQDENYNYQYAEKSLISRLKVDEGDTMTVRDLIYSALVGSANNAVESLVRVSGLSRNNFISRMNQKAENWGAKSTKFFEPTGLDPRNVSSSLDYAIISRAVLKNSFIAKASILPKYVFATINTKIKHSIKNTDKIINSQVFNITGSKTGYLDEAGFCLMTSVEEDGNKVIVVTLGSATRATSFSETSELIEYGLSKL